MGQVLELKQKITADWTVVERLQLDTLVSCLPARLAQEVEFGVSDVGDPWCAVLNEDGEVVLHVARIDGRFFVHSTIEPFVAEARDLPTAVTPFVGEGFLQNRHVASITPMYGLMMPLHAYAMPSEAPVEPRAEMLDLAPAAPFAEAEAPTHDLPDAPEPWSAPVFTLNPGDQPLEPQPQAAEQVLFPIQESDWASPMSGQLLDFSAPPKIESITSLEFGDVTFAPFVLNEPAPAVIMAEAPAATDDHAETAPTGGQGGSTPAGGNVISIDFGQASTGNGSMLPHNGLATGALDGLERAASGVELVISDVDPGVIVAWTDTPHTLMGVAPAAEAF
jgi:hypothetical protein